MNSLLAESGATKTEWRLFDHSGVLKTYNTQGLNPTSTTKEALLKSIEQVWNKIQEDGMHLPVDIFFYGAGLGHEKQREKISQALLSFFPQSNSHVYSDLLAASRSTGKRKGIVAILGTGSNSCLFEDDKVIQQFGGWGYLVGDEGSGADLGKQLLKLLIHQELPDSLSNALLSKLDMNLKDFVNYVQQCERPSLTLASLTPLIAQYKDHELLKDVIGERFRIFLFQTIMKYETKQELRVDFVGSVAYYFQNILLEQCRILAVSVDKIIKDPIENLLNFHLMSKV